LTAIGDITIAILVPIHCVPVTSLQLLLVITMIICQVLHLAPFKGAICGEWRRDPSELGPP
uniref:Uncharacterized protein n=1 Tax=Otolemur garnettii TaxID=30611 RepID=H0XY19_OTOGA